MDRRFGVLLPAGAAQRLAVDGDDLRGRAGQRRHPGHEAALELLGVEGGEDVAEVIVRRRAVAKRPEPAQQLDLLLAEPRDIDEGLRPRQHRQQAQQQHLGKRIDHLAGLARVRQILEIVQENNRLAERRQLRTARSIAVLRIRIRGPRQIQHSIHLSRTPSPAELITRRCSAVCLCSPRRSGAGSRPAWLSLAR